MSKKTVYAVPNKGCDNNFTAGKRYRVLSEIEKNNWNNFIVYDNKGHECFCSWINSGLGCGNWTRIEE
jgi:hypothetical protein